MSFEKSNQEKWQRVYKKILTWLAHLSTLPEKDPQPTNKEYKPIHSIELWRPFFTGSGYFEMSCSESDPEVNEAYSLLQGAVELLPIEVPSIKLTKLYHSPSPSTQFISDRNFAAQGLIVRIHSSKPPTRPHSSEYRNAIADCWHPGKEANTVIVFDPDTMPLSYGGTTEEEEKLWANFNGKTKDWYIPVDKAPLKYSDPSLFGSTFLLTIEDEEFVILFRHPDRAYSPLPHKYSIKIGLATDPEIVEELNRLRTDLAKPDKLTNLLAHLPTAPVA